MSVFLVPEEEEESYLNFASLREHCWPELVVHVLVTLLLCPTPNISYPFFGLRPQMEFSLSGMPFHLSSFLTFCYFNALFHFLSLSACQLPFLSAFVFPVLLIPSLSHVKNFIQLASRSALTSLSLIWSPDEKKSWGADRGPVAEYYRGVE